MTPEQNSLLKRLTTSLLLMSCLAFLWDNGDILPHYSKDLSRLSLDIRHKHFSPLISPSDKIVFIDIDSESLKTISTTEGQWPWRRSVWIHTMQALSAYAPKAVLFDILFSEDDSKNAGFDQQLASAVAERTNVSLAMGFENKSVDKDARLPASDLSKFSVDIGDLAAKSNHFNYVSKPYPSLLANSTHLHIVTTFKDSDGVMRSAPMFLDFQEQHYPSLSLKSLQLYFDRSYLFWEGSHLRLVSKSEDFDIPLDSEGRLSLQFYSGSFRTVPLSLIYKLARRQQNADVLRHALQNKILIIGSSAAELNDLKSTPVANNYPGALLHATAISNILETHFIYKPFANNDFVLTILIIVLIYLNFALTQNRLWKISGPLALLFTYTLISLYVFKVDQMDVPLATPLLFGGLSYADGLLLILVSEMKTKLKWKFPSLANVFR